MTVTATSPKVFVSYSWSSPDYSERVLQLAEHLVSDGVDVILDRWHLREGQDAYSFMERSVTDPEVQYVLILCDPMYVSKADRREGGVGTETLIISPDVYQEAKQTKFIPVLMERDEDGEVVVPAYLRSRIYIDLSRPEAEAEQYERLLRMIFGKPAVVRPPLGKRPAFLDEERPVLLTGRSLEQYKDAVLRDQPTKFGHLSTYLDRLVLAFERERVERAENGPDLLEKIRESLERFLPYRDEFADLMGFLRDFGEGLRSYDLLHRFFERLLIVRATHGIEGYNQSAATENLGFLIRELWLYAVAALIRAERFEELERLFAPFYIKAQGEHAGRTYSIGVVEPALPQLDRRGHPLTDPIAMMLKERATLRAFPYEMLAEAEFLLAMRRLLTRWNGWENRWIPRGSGWEWDPGRLPLVVRMQNPTYVERLYPALGVRDRADLIEQIGAMDERDPVSGISGAMWMNRRTMSEMLGLPAVG